MKGTKNRTSKTKNREVDWTATLEEARRLRRGLDAETCGKRTAAVVRYERFLKRLDREGVELVVDQFSGAPLAITTMPVVLAGRLPTR